MSDTETNPDPAEESLIYQPSKVSWGTAQFVAKPPSLTARLFVYLLAFSLIAGLIYAHFAQVPVAVESRGALITEKPLMPVNTPVNLKVKTLLVEEGLMVKKGDPLLTPEDLLTRKDYDKLKKDTEKIELLLEKDFSSCTTCSKSLQQMIDEDFQIEGTGGIVDVLAPSVQLMRNLITSMELIKKLPATTKSLRRRIMTARSKLKQIEARGATTTLALQVEQLQGEIAQAEGSLSERRLNATSQTDQSKSQLQSNISSLRVALEKYRNKSIFTAPIDGMVVNLNLSGTGQIVSAGQQLMALVPSNSLLIAQLLVANKDIALVKSGMAARIKLDAFPERDYGVLDGKVASVPKSAVKVTGPQGQPLSGYHVRLSLDKQAFKKGPKDYPFRLGMSLTGLVITRYESLLSIAIRKLLNIKDDVLGY